MDVKSAADLRRLILSGHELTDDQLIEVVNYKREDRRNAKPITKIKSSRKQPDTTKLVHETITGKSNE